MTPRLKPMLTTIAAWQFACLAVMHVYRYFIGYGVVAIYSWWYGDIQASYEKFERFSKYIEIAVVTIPSTCGSLLLFDKLLHRTTARKHRAAFFIGWEIAVVGILIVAYESGLTYSIIQVFWKLFGPPENVYSFRNLALHRVVTWLLCTVPVAWIVLCRYSYSECPREAESGRQSESFASLH